MPAALKRSAPFVAEPVPEMLSGSAIDTAPTASVPPLDTVVVPEVLPRALVLPAVRIPPLTVIEPEYDELAPDNVSVPVPDFVKAPEPETTPETVAVAKEATWTVESDETVTAPEAVPEPEKYSAQPMTRPPLTASMAPPSSMHQLVTSLRLQLWSSRLNHQERCYFQR